MKPSKGGVSAVSRLLEGHHVADGVAKSSVKRIYISGEDQLESPQSRHLEYLYNPHPPKQGNPGIIRYISFNVKL